MAVVELHRMNIAEPGIIDTLDPFISYDMYHILGRDCDHILCHIDPSRLSEEAEYLILANDAIFDLNINQPALCRFPALHTSYPAVLALP